MANLCDTNFILTGSRKAVNDLWNTMKKLGVESGNLPLFKLAEHYGIDYEKKHISVRGHIYWASYEEDETEDLYKLSFDVESGWTPTVELFETINEILWDELELHYRAIEPGCEIFTVCDPGCLWFPEDCCVSAYGEPFDDMFEDCLDSIGDAINIWCDKTGIERGDRTDREMMDFINSYEYENDDTYFRIYEFDFV